MSLPKQTLPIFPVTVPSTKKKTSFRQFTVREEKMMAQAQQSDDIAVITQTIREVIAACVKDIEVDNLALFDVEYLVMKIRSKSVGEVIELSLPCDKDKTHKKSPVVINLDKVEVTFPEGHERNIKLYGDVGVVMKYPTLAMMIDMEGASGTDAIVNCIESIYTDEEVFDTRDQTKEQLLEWIDGLTKEQVDKINELFFQKMPNIKIPIRYECVECGHKHEKYIKGLANFFV